MSKLYTKIQDMLDQDYSPVTIAHALEIPLSWIYEVLEPNWPDVASPTDDELDAMAEYYGA
jgi:hypothetical protein